MGIASFLDWIYPPRCRGCRALLRGGADDGFCGACRERIELVSHPLCPACGRPFLATSGDDHLCGPCIERPPHFRRARAWACYPTEAVDGHPLRDVVQRFKYGRKLSLGRPLGRLLARDAAPWFAGCGIDLVLPVPLHLKRLRWRGFNQALVLAREVGRNWNVPVDPFVLVRWRETEPQTRLSEQERRRNVRAAFAVAPGKSVEAKTVLLVDDIYTSGATVNECSRILVRAGCAEVYVLTLARAVS